MPLTLTCLHPRVSAISAPIPTCQADGHGGSKAWSAAAFPQDDRRRPWQHAPGVNGSANARRLPPLELAENRPYQRGGLHGYVPSLHRPHSP